MSKAVRKVFLISSRGAVLEKEKWTVENIGWRERIERLSGGRGGRGEGGLITAASLVRHLSPPLS
jgi:hypothetical protein